MIPDGKILYFSNSGFIRQLSEVPNVVVEWLTLLFGIWEVPDSNLGPETGYPRRFSVVFLGPFRKIPV
jgi:hypothetical protein